MFVYSQNIRHFIRRLHHMVDQILTFEVGVTPGRKPGSFYYGHGGSCTFSIEIFQSSSKLGFFDSHLYEIGINHTLMYSAKDKVLANILRHEIAHLMIHLWHRHDPDCENETAHGRLFRSFCAAHHWGEDVFRASDSVENMNQLAGNDQKADKMISKVKKLLRLAESSNRHEAELATVKANEILLQYNLSLSQENTYSDDHCCYMKRVLCVKRTNAKFKAISRILDTFYVSSVYHGWGGVMYLEVIGSLANVDIAEYVAGFLDKKLDEIWQETRKKNPHIKGLAAKNSFLRGVAQGYVARIEALKENLPADGQHAIMVVENELERMKDLACPSLVSSHSSYKNNEESNALGKAAGSQLTINKSVSGSKQTPLLT